MCSATNLLPSPSRLLYRPREFLSVTLSGKGRIRGVASGDWGSTFLALLEDVAALRSLVSKGWKRGNGKANATQSNYTCNVKQIKTPNL